MENRRTLLKMLMALVLGAPLAPRILAPAAAAAGRDGFFIVNGWVLTRADLDALKIDAL